MSMHNKRGGLVLAMGRILYIVCIFASGEFRPFRNHWRVSRYLTLAMRTGLTN